MSEESGGRAGIGAVRWRVEYLVVPVLAFYALTLFWPALRMVLVSMPEGDPFRYYRDILTSGLYQEAMLRTFVYSVIATLGTLVLGYPLAYFMVLGRTWIRISVTVLVVVPMFVALLVRTFGWMMIFSRTGPINRVLLSLDLIEEPMRLMYTTFAVQVGMVAVLLPFMVLPLYATMRRIDPGLLQAARGLGAPPPSVFAFVFMPLSMPGVYAGIMIVFVLSLGFYITPDLLGGSSNQVYAVLLAKAVKLNSTRPGLPAAMAALLLLVAMMVLAICARLVSGERSLGGRDAAAGLAAKERRPALRGMVASLSGWRARRVHTADGEAALLAAYPSRNPARRAGDRIVDRADLRRARVFLRPLHLPSPSRLPSSR